MDWPTEDIMEFLRIYQMYPCIWHPMDRQYRCKNNVKKAWMEIADRMGEPFTVKDLKRKKESLMAAYRLNKTKVRKSELSGGEIFQPTWFGFEFMDSFLSSVYTPSLTEDQENHLEDDSKATLEDGSDSSIFEVKADPLHLEQESSSRASTPRSVNQGYSRPTSSFIPSKRRQDHSPELQSEQNHIDQTIAILNNVAKDKDEEDECYYFGKIIEKKMRKLPEERRDLMMIKINQLLYEEQYEHKWGSATESPTNSNM